MNGSSDLDANSLALDPKAGDLLNGEPAAVVGEPAVAPTAFAALTEVLAELRDLRENFEAKIRSVVRSLARTGTLT